jgi:drug/metabolite transporter (DMT)-like permease
MTQSDRTLPGVVLMLIFCLFGPLLDFASKLATETIPVGQITAARFVVQGALMVPVALLMGLSWRVDGRMAGWLTLRAAFLILSTFCFVSGVSVMPVADALAIVFVEPFIVLFLGYWLFGDSIGPRRILASLAAFGGAMLVIQPSLAAFGLVALFPLGTAFLFGGYMLITRAMAANIHPVTMQLHTSIAGTLVCLPVLFIANGTGWLQLDPVMPQGNAWLWLFGVGFWACLAHICITYALKFAPAATVAPLQYFEIVVAVILGYLIYGDWPKPLTWVGIVIIIVAGLYLVHREQVAAKGRRRDQSLIAEAP